MRQTVRAAPLLALCGGVVGAGSFPYSADVAAAAYSLPFPPPAAAHHHHHHHPSGEHEVFEVNTTSEIDWDDLRRVGAEFEHENIIMLGSKVLFPALSSLLCFTRLPGHAFHIRKAS